MVRYSLRDVFCVQTLAPISAGVVYAADLFSAAVLDYFDPIDSIASATGWPLYTMHNLFFITLSTIAGIFFGGLIALVMLSLLLLRNRWATLVAFSLPFGILCFLCLRFWMVAFPVNAKMALLVAKWSIMPALVAICLLFLGWRFINRKPTHELGAKTGFLQRPPWQRYLIAATCVIYLSASAYGWYGMVSFRTEMIKTWRHLEQSEQQQAVPPENSIGGVSSENRIENKLRAEQQTTEDGRKQIEERPKQAKFQGQRKPAATITFHGSLQVAMLPIESRFAMATIFTLITELPE